MATATVTYKGALRTSCVHLKSNTTILTDAPTDNNGKGASFSPTDTLATALASCILTIMGMKAESLKVELKGAKATVTKKMIGSPRRISEIDIRFEMPENIDEKIQRILEKVANSCPVHHSLHPDIEKNITFYWGILDTAIK